jgi:hypothetical protein
VTDSSHDKDSKVEYDDKMTIDKMTRKKMCVDKMTVGKMVVVIITIESMLWLPLIDIREYIDCSSAWLANLILVE